MEATGRSHPALFQVAEGMGFALFNCSVVIITKMYARHGKEIIPFVPCKETSPPLPYSSVYVPVPW